MRCDLVLGRPASSKHLANSAARAMTARSCRDVFYSFCFYMYHPLVGMNTTFFIHSAPPLPARAFVPLAAVPSGPRHPASMLHYRRPHTHHAGLLPTSQYGQVHKSCLCCNVWYAVWQECGGGVRRGRTIQRVMGDHTRSASGPSPQHNSKPPLRRSQQHTHHNTRARPVREREWYLKNGQRAMCHTIHAPRLRRCTPQAPCRTHERRL